MLANQDGVMWTQLKHMIQRCNTKRSVTANMIVFWDVSVKFLCFVLVSINALAMGAAGVDFVRWAFELSYILILYVCVCMTKT